MCLASFASDVSMPSPPLFAIQHFPAPKLVTRNCPMRIAEPTGFSEPPGCAFSFLLRFLVFIRQWPAVAEPERSAMVGSAGSLHGSRRPPASGRPARPRTAPARRRCMSHTLPNQSVRATAS